MYAGYGVLEKMRLSCIPMPPSPSPYQLAFYWSCIPKAPTAVLQQSCDLVFPHVLIIVVVSLDLLLKLVRPDLVLLFVLAILLLLLRVLAADLISCPCIQNGLCQYHCTKVSSPLIHGRVKKKNTNDDRHCLLIIIIVSITNVWIINNGQIPASSSIN